VGRAHAGTDCDRSRCSVSTTHRRYEAGIAALRKGSSGRVRNDSGARFDNSHGSRRVPIRLDPAEGAFPRRPAWARTPWGESWRFRSVACGRCLLGRRLVNNPNAKSGSQEVVPVIVGVRFRSRHPTRAHHRAPSDPESPWRLAPLHSRDRSNDLANSPALAGLAPPIRRSRPRSGGID